MRVYKGSLNPYHGWRTLLSDVPIHYSMAQGQGKWHGASCRSCNNYRQKLNCQDVKNALPKDKYCHWSINKYQRV